MKKIQPNESYFRVISKIPDKSQVIRKNGKYNIVWNYFMKKITFY